MLQPEVNHDPIETSSERNSNRLSLIVMLSVCVILGFLGTVFPPLGLGLTVFALWCIPGARRSEFICLFWLAGIVQYFLILPFLLVTHRGRVFTFVGLALLRIIEVTWFLH